MFTGPQSWVSQGKKPAATSVSFSGAFVDSQADTTSSSTKTFTAIGFGAADSNRVVVAAFAFRSDTGAETISGVTIGGVSATRVTSAFQNDAGLVTSDIWYATGVSGTSGDVVITFSGNIETGACGTYRIVTGTTTPTFGGGAVNSGASISTSLTVPASGFGIAVAGNRQLAVSDIVWTNAVSDWNQNDATNQRSFAGAHATLSNTITATPALSANNAISVAAWGA